MPNDSAADPVRLALIELLDALIDYELSEKLEAGCDAEGPVCRAYDALGIPYPDALQEYLDAAGDED